MCDALTHTHTHCTNTHTPTIIHPHMHATHKFTDWLRSARSASRMAVFLSFSAWQTYQPSSGGAPSACAHLKYTHTHTHLLLTQVDTCSRNKLNQTSALQISFLIPLAPSPSPSLPLWPHPDLSSCSPTSPLFLVLRSPTTALTPTTTSNSPSGLFFICLAVLCVHVLVSTLPSQWACAPLCRVQPVQRSRWLSNTCVHTDNHDHWHTRAWKTGLQEYTLLCKMSWLIRIYS